MLESVGGPMSGFSSILEESSEDSGLVSIEGSVSLTGWDCSHSRYASTFIGGWVCFLGICILAMVEERGPCGA